MSDLITRAWNGTPISRRTTDGYVNATAMAKANGKQWSHYRETDRANTYLEALSRNTGIRVADLYIAKQGEGTWIHPRLAVDFARWISPEFAVWMDGWFLESLAAQQGGDPVAPAPLALPDPMTPERVIAAVERTVDIFERLGGLDDRDRLLFKDIVRTSLARASGGLLLPAGESNGEVTISDAWLEVFGSPLKREKAPTVGRDVAAKYRQEFGGDPPKRTQYVDGAPRSVFSYQRDWLVPLFHKLKTKFLGLPE